MSSSSASPATEGDQQEANDLGRALRAARLAKGLTQDDAASALGVHQVSLSAWELGKAQPRVARLHRIAALYGVTVAQLLTPDAAA